MSFKEIKELRRNGDLVAALQLATQSLENDPQNIWNKRAAAWVYYDYLKLNLNIDSFSVFIEYLTKIKNLQLPENERMVFDNCAWQIGKFLFSLDRELEGSFSKVSALFDIVKCFHFTKPSDGYSFLYKAFHKGYINWPKYLEFADWWGFENFRSEDYLQEEYQGRKIMALVEQAYIAYSKKILEGEPHDQFVHHKVIDKEKVRSFLPQLDELIDKHKNYQYPAYFKAKLLLAVGDESNILSAFLPFAKQKRNEFWVWELMADIFANEQDIQFACYCKALSLKTKEDFLIKLRESFAKLLIEKQMFAEAKVEISKIITVRKKHEWRLTDNIQRWIDEAWFKEGDVNNDNSQLYKNHLAKAEELLYRDIPEEVVVVEFVNSNKEILNFVKNKTKYGFFNYSGFIEKPVVGDILKVRFKGNMDTGFFNVLTVDKDVNTSEAEAIRKIHGEVRLPMGKSFGFVDDVFIDQNVIKENNIANRDQINGIAIQSFNKKKETWGWKAISISRND